MRALPRDEKPNVLTCCAPISEVMLYAAHVQTRPLGLNGAHACSRTTSYMTVSRKCQDFSAFHPLGTAAKKNAGIFVCAVKFFEYDFEKAGGFFAWPDDKMKMYVLIALFSQFKNLLLRHRADVSESEGRVCLRMAIEEADF